VRGFLPQVALPAEVEAKVAEAVSLPYGAIDGNVAADPRKGWHGILRLHTKIHVIKYFLYDGPAFGIVAARLVGRRCHET